MNSEEHDINRASTSFTSVYRNEDILLDEIKRGSHKAFRFLYKRFSARLQRYAFRFTQDEDIAEDIVQECFLKFWEKREMVHAVSLSSLLFAMTRNACLNYLKHEGLLNVQPLDYLKEFEGEERLYHLDLGYNPENTLLYEDLQKQLKSIINELPDRCREIFILSRFKGLKNREIAKRLQISTTAVEKHISKALHILSEKLAVEYTTPIFSILLAWLIQG